MEYHVEFLHRTVKDFLLEKEILAILKANAGSDFDPKLELCKILLTQFKALPECAFSFPDEAGVTIWVKNMVEEVKHLAKEAGILDNQNPNYELLQEMEYTRLDRGVEENRRCPDGRILEDGDNEDNEDEFDEFDEEKSGDDKIEGGNSFEEEWKDIYDDED